MLINFRAPKTRSLFSESDFLKCKYSCLKKKRLKTDILLCLCQQRISENGNNTDPLARMTCKSVKCSIFFKIMIIIKEERREGKKEVKRRGKLEGKEEKTVNLRLWVRL